MKGEREKVILITAKVLLAALLAVATCFMPFNVVDANASEASCLDFLGNWSPRDRLSRREHEFANQTAERGKVLALGMMEVEMILTEANLTPSEFSEKGLAWAAVVDGDRHRVGVYRMNEARIEKWVSLQSDDDSDLDVRFRLAEQALAATPLDCSRSFGVLELGLNSEDGVRTLYSLQLVDRSRELAWGMHYRFEALNEELQHIDRLHVHCSVTSVASNVDPDDRRFRRGSFAIVESMPGMELPTEAQLMQLHLYPDLPNSVEFVFWTQEGVFAFERNQSDFPRRYFKKANPCSLADAE